MVNRKKYVFRVMRGRALGLSRRKKEPSETDSYDVRDKSSERKRMRLEPDNALSAETNSQTVAIDDEFDTPTTSDMSACPKRTSQQIPNIDDFGRPTTSGDSACLKRNLQPIANVDNFDRSTNSGVRACFEQTSKPIPNVDDFGIPTTSGGSACLKRHLQPIINVDNFDRLTTSGVSACLDRTSQPIPSVNEFGIPTTSGGSACLKRSWQSIPNADGFDTPKAGGVGARLEKNATQNCIADNIDTPATGDHTDKRCASDIGRRIISVTHFFNKLKEISEHGPLGCGMSALVMLGEKKNGLSSYFTIMCQMCNMKFYIPSDCANENYLNINGCAVAGAMSVGGGHSMLEEMLAAMNLPLVSSKTYQEQHNIISNSWEKVALELMENAGKLERELSIAEGRVNKDGIPIIDVIADGCWSKQSYKKNYSALSGAGAIIGRRTGLVLYIGVRNKYCYTCARLDKNNEVSRPHTCFKNYSGPSTGMESCIIVEGFKQSIATHNLIYGRLISDGDSSTYAKIIQSRPYADYTVEKVECRNHVLRNFCNKLQLLTTDTKYLIRFRKMLTKTKILSMRSVICKAIKHNKNSTCPDVQVLFNDILLAHLHSFGNHAKCKSYFCNKVGAQEDVIPEFFCSTLWQRICNILSTVASQARSLSYDVDSNAVEGYHSIIAKFVGGKRINFSLKNSYKTRCMASVVAFNDKRPLSRLYKNMAKGSPQGTLKVVEKRRMRKMALNRKYQKHKPRVLFSKPDQEYGEESLKPDMPPELFSEMKVKYLENLIKTDDQLAYIERNTILQRDSSEWLEMRRSLVTASNFGRIIKKRPNTKTGNIVKDLIYKVNIDNVASIKHGQENEKNALSQLAKQENVIIKPCGLFIDSDMPYLGATPDGIVDDDETIVEIKCPITANRLGIEEAIHQRKVNFWIKNNDRLEINKNHGWYYQIQGQLHITKRKKCLFAVWVNENEKLKTEVIYKDDLFWEHNMKEKLVNFFMECMLPELIDPRITRNLMIREPEQVQRAIRKKNTGKTQIT